VALGARPGQIVALVLTHALIVTAVGIATGVGAAYVASRSLGTLLYGVSPHDPYSFGATAAVLGLVALAACTAPAMRAMRIDPLAQLRR
jgi:ABC-type antimicrobial peptide transport system permease subunit